MLQSSPAMCGTTARTHPSESRAHPHVRVRPRRLGPHPLIPSERAGGHPVPGTIRPSKSWTPASGAWTWAVCRSFHGLAEAAGVSAPGPRPHRHYRHRRRYRRCPSANAVQPDRRPPVSPRR